MKEPNLKDIKIKEYYILFLISLILLQKTDSLANNLLEEEHRKINEKIAVELLYLEFTNYILWIKQIINDLKKKVLDTDHKDIVKKNINLQLDNIVPQLRTNLVYLFNLEDQIEDYKNYGITTGSNNILFQKIPNPKFYRLEKFNMDENYLDDLRENLKYLQVSVSVNNIYYKRTEKVVKKLPNHNYRLYSFKN